MIADTFIKAQLAMHAWRLARDVEGRRQQPTLELMKCFAYVQRNRVVAGWMGGDWLRVMAAESVYSARRTDAAQEVPGEVPDPGGDRVTSEDLKQAAQREFPDLGEPVMQKFLWEIDRIFEGSAPDKMTAGGLWWCELNKVDRPWFLENIARKAELHPRVAHVGNVTLFK